MILVPSIVSICEKKVSKTLVTRAPEKYLMPQIATQNKKGFREGKYTLTNSLNNLLYNDLIAKPTYFELEYRA